MSLTQAELDLRERIEHQETLSSIREMLATKGGKHFIKYLFKNFEVGELPEIGVTGELLMDRLGFLRAGRSIFQIVAQANPEVAGSILGQLEKEKYAQEVYTQARGE